MKTRSAQEWKGVFMMKKKNSKQKKNEQAIVKLTDEELQGEK